MAKYKTLTFACVHMLVAFTVVGLMTGSWALGGLVALIEPAINTVAYFFHERLWERWTSRPAGQAEAAAAELERADRWAMPDAETPAV